ncbi:MAG: LPS-assembly protein LptD [Endomicrobiaceae bacterium]
MLNFKKKSYILYLIFSLFLYAGHLYAYEVNIKADSLTYEQDTEVITSSGNVQLDWLGKIMQADNIEMRIPKKELKADGHVSIKEPNNTIFADSVKYDMEKESGTMNNTLGYSASVFFRAEKMTKVSSDTYRIENVKISNCDLDNPHHYAYAKEGLFIVDKKITIYKATYYAGGIPIFYFPKYTKYLKAGDGSKFSYEIEPGYSNDGGIIAKAKIKYKFTDKFDAKLYLDYLGRVGEGVGVEANYYERDKLKATLYTYGVKDTLDDSQRWLVRPSYWQRINDLWTVQSHAEFVSDSYFNNTYQQDDWNRVLNKRRSYVSFTRQSPKSTLMLLSELYQIYNPVTDKLQEGSYTKFPQISYSIYPAKTYGAVSNFTFNFENQYNYEYAYNDKNYDYNCIVSTADYNITKDYKISKRFTLKPTLGINETFKDSVNPEDDSDNFVSRYYASLNARYRLAWWMDWNVSYDSKIRSDINSLGIDSDSDDKGFEKNALVFNNYMYLSSNFIVRNYTGYDFRDIGNSDYIDWYPFITELTYAPTSKFTAYLKQQQDLHPFRFNSLQLDTKIGQLERCYLDFSAFYYEYNPEEADVVAGIGFWLNSKWRLDYLIRTTCSFKDFSFSGHDQEFKLYRDMHCFNFGTSFRVREGYYELYFKFEMKTNVPTLVKKDGTKEIEEEFYPWR